MTGKLYQVFRIILDRFIQIVISILGGLWAAIEASTLFFAPCFLAVIIDVISAVYLAKRVHQKHPERSEGKFKSEYKYRVLTTMIVVFVAIIIAHYVDTLVFDGGNQAQCWVLGFFLFYEGWSILENWSSENNNKLAKVMQRIMVNKAERHINVPISDIMFDEEKKEEKENEID